MLWHGLEFSEKQAGNGKVESKDHPHVRRPMIERGSEIPLPHGTTRRSHHWSLAEKRIMDQLEKPEVTVPNQENEHTEDSKLDSDPPFGVILFVFEPHDDVHHEKIIRVQEADVVENKGCSLGQAQEENQKVQSPEHLQDSNDAIIGLQVKEGKISKTGHPNVAGNHDSDRVVNIFCVVVVIQQEHKLHPTLPFFRLVSV
mmetsp:Transcript_9511/g.23677  ORF Transcript_9511/g.23677 Transcript_9511/m.23677 type:complete len:200 (-) Transcript_9511:515-1114(-)